MVLNHEKMFDSLFSKPSLVARYSERFQFSSAKGVDRLSGFQFKERSESELSIASAKCLNGTYRFAPYLEVLKSKGRSKLPRVISVPTVRDRIVLNQLKEFLALVFPECVPKQTAATLMREVLDALRKEDVANTQVCGCDIKDFYPSLDQVRLLKLIKSRVSDPRAIALVRRSIVTPTVPFATRRVDHGAYSPNAGVPQGLAISNILAAIYMDPIDEGMKSKGVKYQRYVDDVLMFGIASDVADAHRSFVARARARRLRVHPLKSGKSHITPMANQFSYLGYVFEWPRITVRASTVERLLQSIAAQFSAYRHNKGRELARRKYLNPDRYREIFLAELNERISGAVSENRRYGWVAYFSQITDLSLLYRLDWVVAGFFSRMPDFGRKPPANLKKFSRALFEMKFSPYGGYVLNFDAIDTTTLKLSFLASRGLVDDDEALTEQQIEGRYLTHRKKILGSMLSDEDMIY